MQESGKPLSCILNMSNLQKRVPFCGAGEKPEDYFSVSVFFIDTEDSQDCRGREGTLFYSSLPLPPAHEHSDIYL